MKLTKEMRKTLFSFNDQERKIFLGLSDDEKEYILHLSEKERKQYFEILYDDDSNSNNNNISPFKPTSSSKTSKPSRLAINFKPTSSSKTSKPSRLAINFKPTTLNQVRNKKQIKTNNNITSDFKFDDGIFQKENTSLNKNKPFYQFSNDIFQKENRSLNRNIGHFNFHDDIFQKKHPGFHLKKKHMKNVVMPYRLEVEGEKHRNIDIFFQKYYEKIKRLLVSNLKQLLSIKVQMTLNVRFKKPESSEDSYHNTNTKMESVFEGSNIDEIIEKMINHIKEKFETVKLPSSGFYIDEIIFLDVDVYKLISTRGGSWKALPKWIAKKKAIHNPKSVNGECFKDSTTCNLHSEDIGAHPERISKLKKYEVNYDSSGLKFPLALKDIDKFEKNNPDICVHVIGLSDDGEFYPLRRSDNYNREKKVRLFFHDGHYSSIKSMSRLLGSSNSKNGHT